jgi:tRNA(fMet)-specific endonuclease VapC
MPRVMLDTNIRIHAIKRNNAAVLGRLEKTRPQDVTISSIVAGELWTEVFKSHRRRRNQQAFNEFLAFVEVLDWPAEAARLYGEIRAELEAKGRLIRAMNLLIAAHAVPVPIEDVAGEAKDLIRKRLHYMKAYWT